MEISKDRLLDIATRDMRMYESMFGCPTEIEKVGYEMYGPDYSRYEMYGPDYRMMAIEVSYKDGRKVTLCSGNDLDEIAKSYLKDLKTVWGTESLEEFEMLMESRGF